MVASTQEAKWFENFACQSGQRYVFIQNIVVCVDFRSCLKGRLPARKFMVLVAYQSNSVEDGLTALGKIMCVQLS